MNEEQKENLIIKILAEEKEKISPDKELLKNILLKLDVTNVSDRRFIYRDEDDKGRVSDNAKTPKQKLRFATGQVYNPMTINWKLVFGLIILAIVVSVSYYQFVLNKPSEIAKAPTEIEIVPATGNIDDVALALLNDVDAESAILANIENDANLLIADSQAIDDFGQSYNEEF